MITTAQQYGITQARLDELCHEKVVFPIPDYERFFINKIGEVYVIVINKDGTSGMEKLDPYKRDKKRNICTYSIANANNEIEHKTNFELCAITFYGYFPFEYARLHNDRFDSKASIYYDLGNIIRDKNDQVIIRGITFRRIYYKNKKPTYMFISRNGILYNDNRGHIPSYEYQHNFYLRARVGVDKYNAKMFGVHRLVYNTWNRVWLEESLQINHIDGYKYHNDIKNLEAVSGIENIRHAKQTGLKKAPYSEDYIERLCQLIQDNEYDIDEIVMKMNGSLDDYGRIKSLIHNIVTKKSWRDISCRYNFDGYINQKHSRKSVRTADAICKAYVETGYDKMAVINQFPGMSKSQIDAICRGFAFPDVAAKYGLPLKNLKRQALSKANFRVARKMLTEGSSTKEVASHFGVSENVIKQLHWAMLREQRLKGEGSTTIERVSKEKDLRE